MFNINIESEAVEKIAVTAIKSVAKLATNPVAATAVTVIALGTVATVAWYKHEENKDKRKYEYAKNNIEF